MCGSVILMEMEGNAAKFYGQPMKPQMQNALFSLANHSLVSTSKIQMYNKFGFKTPPFSFLF